MKKENIILEKSFKFAVRIYKLSKYLKDMKEFSLADQLLKAGTSISANVFESTTGQSKNDFISKISISLKEAKETEF
jgi:four helix bundle protein